ncbi:tetratricopeptide repeat protein [Cyanobacteria bacterium FACHB-471]|nr:tetratricopeptide repeat protein [Cyanobacteria bacterium FACHB-471]
MNRLKSKHLQLTRQIGIVALLIWLNLTSAGIAQTTSNEPSTLIEPPETALCQQEAIAIDTELKAEACYHLGLELMDRGRYEEAVAALSRTIELNPDDSDAYLWRAAAYDAIYNIEAAMEDSLRAVELDADRVLSNWLSRQRPGEEEEADELLDTGIRLCRPPSNINSRSRGLNYIQRALNLYASTGQQEEAQRAGEAFTRCRRTQT